MKKLGILMIISLFAVVLSACGGKSDADIQKEVEGRVKARAPQVTVAVKDAVVTLGGQVTTPEEKAAAVAAAKGEGVKNVQDNIQTRPAPTPMMPVATPMISPAGSPMTSPARPGTSPARR
jgi:hypothetical protein